MKKKCNYIELNLLYYRSKLVEKLMALAFNIDFVIRHRRRPKRATKEQVLEFKRFLDAKKGGKE